MRKLIPAFFCCVIVFYLVGCAGKSRVPTPIPAPQPSDKTAAPVPDEKSEKQAAKEDRKRLKTKIEITKTIDSLRAKIKKTEKMLADKRAEGINVSQAEEVFKNSRNLLEEAERLYLEANLTENYEPVAAILRAIEDSFEKIKEEVKKAPRFREKTKPQPGEYHDERDKIFQKLGHPDPRNVHVGPDFSFSFSIHDPTQILEFVRCFKGGTFTLQYPPKVMIVEFTDGQIVFIENNPSIVQFTKDNFSPEARDHALASMCLSQGSGYENFVFLAAYSDKMAGRPEDYLLQLLSGQFRFVDQFGLGALSESTKGSAPLADLELVSLVFSTKISPLSQAQSQSLDKIYAKIKDYDPALKLKEAFLKIADWRKNLSPKKKEAERFLSLAAAHFEPSEMTELTREVQTFENYLRQFAKEYKYIQKELLKFKKDFGNEVIFWDDEVPVICLLLQGVGFKVEEASAKTLFKKDIPQILVKSELLYFISKNDDQPTVIRAEPLHITEADTSISKDYQRLTSFMLGWPSGKPQPKGHYQLKLTIVDEIREKAVIQEINFSVLPSNLRKNKGGGE